MPAAVAHVTYIQHRVERKLVLDSEAIAGYVRNLIAGRECARVNGKPCGVRNSAARIIGESVRQGGRLHQRRFSTQIPARVGDASHAMEDARSRADGSFAIAENVPGEAEARLEIRIAQRVEAFRHAAK